MDDIHTIIMEERRSCNGGMGVRPIGRGMAAMLIAGQCTPHFSFGLAKRETGRARSKEKKRFGRNFARSCKVAVQESAYRCLLRFCLVFGHAMVFCEVGTAVPWRRARRTLGCKDAFDLLLFPRVPLRYALPWRSWWLVPNKTEGLPRPRRGRCPHRPAYSTAWSQPRTSRWRG